jgi:hypothetical protein
MQATSTIPIVMAISADAVGSGLVSNLGRPGKNVTGVTIMLAEMSAKRLQLLKEAVPNVSRVAVLWNRALPWHHDARGPRHPEPEPPLGPRRGADDRRRPRLQGSCMDYSGTSAR